MKQHEQGLNTEEKIILTAFESGKLRSIPKLKAEKKRLQNIAKAHGVTSRTNLSKNKGFHIVFL